MNATQRARFADQASQLNREIDSFLGLPAVAAVKRKSAKKIPNTVVVGQTTSRKAAANVSRAAA